MNIGIFDSIKIFIKKGNAPEYEIISYSPKRLVIRRRSFRIFRVYLIYAVAPAIIMLIFGGLDQFMLYFYGAVTLLFLTLAAFSIELTITADKTDDTLVLFYHSYLYRRKKVIPFVEIDEIIIEASERPEVVMAQTSYRIELIKKDGKKIPFRSFSADYYSKVVAAEQL
jgi:hypothetical protein